ncbi:hypothetical protein M5X11_13650 [Paenibacillus alginolyticus]|uniref:hypothetical protein n=1 Tax=Paenibacillus alginolyticus TaxID=59839 RepID=UPI000683D994|nr:hypothetical protein [Paenibacillus alginolyticus]MCY9665995.1 hypothetical protein [Paenibacillus alginolyticus]
MKNRIIITLIVTVSTAIGIWLISVLGLFPFDQVKDSAVTKASPTSNIPLIVNETKIDKGTQKTAKELVEQYRLLKVIDSHNHDASDSKYINMLEVWKRNAVNQVVLFGDVSEPSAVMTDQMSWMAYKDNPDVLFLTFLALICMINRVSM